MKIKKGFIKGFNLVLAGLISLLGFVGCEKKGASYPLDEYGSPHADYTVKGTVVNKATGKPIKGIRVGYYPVVQPEPEYGVIATSFQLKSRVIVLTDTDGAFELTDNFFPEKNLTLPVYVDDVDGEENGFFQSEEFEVDFSEAEKSGASGHWYNGEYTMTVSFEQTEIEQDTDE